MRIHLLITLFFSILVLGILSCSPTVAVEGIRIPDDPSIRVRGRALVTGLAACGVCHGDRFGPDAELSGGRKVSDQYGTLIAPNITPARTGIGEWSTFEIVRAIRNSEGRAVGGDEPRKLSHEVHDGYEWMSENDVLAIVAYLRTRVPVENQVERRDLSFFQRNTTGLFDSQGYDVGYVPEIDSKFEVSYGAYLVDHVARCGQCHNSKPGLFGGVEYLGGGKEIVIGEKEKIVPGIQNTAGDGIGSWNEEALVTYLSSGKGPEGVTNEGGLCPTIFYKTAAESDLRSIAKYLKSTPSGN